MAHNLDDQVTTIERALGERMISHALAIVRAWLNELGENNPYEQVFTDLQEEYNTHFSEWLTSDDQTREDRLDAMTGDTYRLVDAVYADLRIKRGLSPVMHGYNKANPQSVMQYFASCLHFTDSDWQWLNQLFNNSDNAATALMAVAALAKNIRDCFSETAMMALIEGMNAENEVVGEQCLANMIILLAHYDVRIDFFPHLQEAFAQAVAEMDDDGEQAFLTLCALVRSARVNWKERLSSGEVTKDDLPPELQSLMDMTGVDDDMNAITSWVPESEQEYMQGVVQLLPDTWVFTFIVGDSAERTRRIAIQYLSIGDMDLMWEHLDEAAQYLLTQLRKGSSSPLDYINYGHCMLLQGDRLMAYENYRQARQLCKSAKDFFTLFRPGRHALVEHGVPVDQVYFIEDQLLNA